MASQYFSPQAISKYWNQGLSAQTIYDSMTRDAFEQGETIPPQSEIMPQIFQFDQQQKAQGIAPTNPEQAQAGLANANRQPVFQGAGIAQHMPPGVFGGGFGTAPGPGISGQTGGQFSANDFANLGQNQLGKFQGWSPQQMADLANQAGNNPNALAYLANEGGAFMGAFSQKFGQQAWNQTYNQAVYGGFRDASGQQDPAVSGLAQSLGGTNQSASGAYTYQPGGGGSFSQTPYNAATQAVGATATNPINAAGNPNADMGNIAYQNQLRQTAMDSSTMNPNGANTWGIQNGTAQDLQGAFGGGVITPSPSTASTASFATAGTAPVQASGLPAAPAAVQGGTVGSAGTAGGAPAGTPVTSDPNIPSQSSAVPPPPTTSTAPTSSAGPSYFGGAVTPPPTPTPPQNTNPYADTSGRVYGVQS